MEIRERWCRLVLRTVCFVFARGGSKGLPGKNIAAGRKAANRPFDRDGAGVFADRNGDRVDRRPSNCRSCAPGAEVPLMRPANWQPMQRPSGWRGGMRSTGLSASAARSM